MTKEPIRQLERWIFIEQQIAVFCETDDFCKSYEEYCHHSLIMTKDEILLKSRMSLSEIMIIFIMFHF